MRVTGIHANLPVADIAAARDFYTDYLGLSVEGFNIGWVARYSIADGEAFVQLVTRDATAPQDSVISVHVGAGVDEAYEEAKRRGYEIVHPLTEEAWGLRRFFVRAPGWQCDQHGEPQRRVGSLSGRFDSKDSWADAVRIAPICRSSRCVVLCHRSKGQEGRGSGILRLDVPSARYVASQR